MNKMSNQRWTKHGKCPFVGTYTGSTTDADTFDADAFVAFFNKSLTIKKGDRGDAVLMLQKGLNHANEVLSLGVVPLVEDSIFGSKTEALVDRVKTRYSIREANVGILTLSKLASVV